MKFFTDDQIKQLIKQEKTKKAMIIILLTILIFLINNKPTKAQIPFPNGNTIQGIEGTYYGYDHDEEVHQIEHLHESTEETNNNQEKIVTIIGISILLPVFFIATKKQRTK